MAVRPATAKDVPALVAYGEAFAPLSKLSTHVTYDAASVTETLTALVESPAGIVLVADTGTQVVGAIVGILTPLYYNKAVLLAQETAWYVDPKARDGRAGLMLLWAFEDYARQAGAALITMSALGPQDAAARIFEKAGYDLAELAYVKKVM